MTMWVLWADQAGRQHKGVDKHTPACNGEAMGRALPVSRNTEPNVEPERALTNSRTLPNQGGSGSHWSAAADRGGLTLKARLQKAGSLHRLGSASLMKKSDLLFLRHFP